MKDPGRAELASMQQSSICTASPSRRGHGHQRPKIEEYGDSLFAVLHNIEFVGGEIKVGESTLRRQEFRLSVRIRPNRASPPCAPAASASPSPEARPGFCSTR